MQLSPGTKLGPYEILTALGAGGMGAVYRARDTRLGRDVAVKVLPPEFAQDAERLARFEREAKLLASLSHPNIAVIHGLEEAEGLRFLVLELVEGETLAARSRRSPLPMDEALHVCVQIAKALEAAHEAGIVHRDLKPGNVMLRPDGTVKVLDFGLAKSGATEAASSDPSLTASPTLTHLATGAGVILGTAAYMSPEQARGRKVDRRTDIWSFGCVLFECLTGRALFEGETVSDLIAGILQTDPAWQALPADTPPHVRALLARCLDKEARSRLRDIGEARIALEGGASRTMSTVADAAAERQASGRSRAFPVAMLIATALVATIATWLVTRQPASPRVTLSVMLPPEERMEAGPEDGVMAISPDGRALVYASKDRGPQRLFLRWLDEPEAIEMPGTSDARNPFFSPDGEWVAFFDDRNLLKTSVRGGTPVVLAHVEENRGGTWLEDDTIVYSPTFASPLFRIDAKGGEARVLTRIDSTRNERTHRWPCALPGGEWVVFTVGLLSSPGGYDDANIEAVSVETGERRVLIRGSCARFAPGGWLVFGRGGSLYAMPLDPENPRAGGSAVPVLDGVLGVSTSGIAFFDVARDGTLALVPGREERRESQFAWVDLQGRTTLLPLEARAFGQFDLSPEGSRALASIGAGHGDDDVFLIDLERGSVNPLTFAAHGGSPRWLPDGQHLVWSGLSASGTAVFLGAISGEDSVRMLMESTFPLTVSDVLADGSAVLVHPYGSANSDIFLAPTNGSGKVRTLFEEPLSQTAGVVSPDGRWIAYVSVNEVCVRPMGHAGGRVQVSQNGGRIPLWAPKGHELYYTSGDNVVAARLTVRGNMLMVESTRNLFELTNPGTDSSLRDIDIHPSGEKFLVRVAVGAAHEMREVQLRLHWDESLHSAIRGTDR